MTGPCELRMGALAPSFAEQLTEQGVPFDPQECELWDRWHDALNLLAIGGPVTHGERQKIQQRMFKTIHKALQRHIDSLAEAEATVGQPPPAGPGSTELKRLVAGR